MKTRIAVDTGGTFTDFVLLDERGIRVHKVRSTPDDPARAILAGIRELLGGHSDEVIHGSTVATNALLERKGARVAFVTTAGFEDILSIGRQTRKELYRLWGERRRPLVEREFIFGVNERLGAGGVVIKHLSDDEIRRIVDDLQSNGPESVALCLLHSYSNAEHEAKLAHALSEAGFTVSASHEILPEHREFERASTTTVNAYVAPIMSRYLARLEQGLPHSVLRVTQSAGGFISATEARRYAVQTVLSGPAGGAVGALALAQASGFPRVIAFDMGGTSTDVSLLDAQLPVTTESVIGDFPVRLPMLDIHTVGAGGGSIAFLDEGGGLRVGPRSAGAVPGPACYGIGDEFTVTDANLLLGRLDPDSFLGGRMALNVERSRKAAGLLATKLGLSEMELAEGVVRIANAHMERALRVVSIQRGFDPRDFALLAFGGAGGMHACDLAASLDIRTVLAPEHAGLLSAWGMLMADYSKQYVRTMLKPAEQVSERELETAFRAMEEKGCADLADAGFDTGSIRMEHALDLRYFGQSYEITVPFSPNYQADFHRAHEKLYGYQNSTRTVELVSARLNAIGRTEKPALPRAESTGQEAVRVRNCEAVFDGRMQQTPLFHRDRMKPGAFGHGPAVIAGAQSTTVVPPRWKFVVDAVGTLVLTYETH